MDSLHFIAGTPRSGSTLLSAILRQNPRIHAGISSPVANLFDGLMKGMGAHSEYYPQITETIRGCVLNGLFASYYMFADNKEIVFDTNRYWCSVMPTLQALLPSSKVVCCVRDLVSILNSFEVLFQKNPLLISKAFKPGEGKTVYQRIDALMAPNGTVGFAWAAFREAFYGPHRKNLVVIDYDELVADPGTAFWYLYGELGLEPFEHDFNKFEMSGGSFDEQLGLPCLHDVQGPVREMNQPKVLPPDLVDRYIGAKFWK